MTGRLAARGEGGGGVDIPLGGWVAGELIKVSLSLSLCGTFSLSPLVRVLPLVVLT